jgi:TPR repeat protein
LLAKIGVRGILPDIAKARSWYEKARELGSAEARGRLETLATR